MVRIVLIRPGSTEYDQQGRITGTLDIPLCPQGKEEVARVVQELRKLGIEALYTSPCQSAAQTAESIGLVLNLKPKVKDKLANLNHGLWQGMLIDEVKHKQPKVYRQWQEHPENVCPPEGEMLDDVHDRVNEILQWILKKHSEGTVALVLPEPLATLVRSQICGCEVGDLWKTFGAGSCWEVLELQPQGTATSS